MKDLLKRVALTAIKAGNEILSFYKDDINFVKKELEECTEEETPINVLDLDEKVEIFTAVMEMSSTEEERAEWHFFPGEFTDESESEISIS